MHYLVDNVYQVIYQIRCTLLSIYCVHAVFVHIDFAYVLHLITRVKLICQYVQTRSTHDFKCNCTHAKGATMINDAD